MIKINKIPKLNYITLTNNGLKFNSYRKLSTSLRLQLNSGSILYKKDIEIEEDIKKILQEHEDLKLKKEAEKKEVEENKKLEEETKLKEESAENNDGISENVIILEAPKTEVVKEVKESKVDTSETSSSEPIELPPPSNSTSTEDSKPTNEQPFQALLTQIQTKFDDVNKQIKNKREEIKNIDWDVYKQKFFDLLKLIGVNLNQVTGYDQIEKLKNNIKVYGKHTQVLYYTILTFFHRA
jgi:malate synthase